MSFQEQLRYYREKAGYKSAKEFAALLGVPYTTYVAYENKGREPRYATLRKISFLLEVSIDTLLENTASIIQQALQDLRKCGFAVSKVNQQNTEDRYVVKWERPKDLDNFTAHEGKIIIDGSGLVAMYELVNSEQKEVVALGQKIRTVEYEKYLNMLYIRTITDLRKDLFMRSSDYREGLKKDNLLEYKRLKALCSETKK